MAELDLKREIAEAEALELALNSVVKEINDYIKNVEKIKPFKGVEITTKQLNDQVQASQELQEAISKRTKAEKEAEKQANKLTKLREKANEGLSDANKEQIKLRTNISKTNKEIKEQIAVEDALGVSYESNEKLLSDLEKTQVKQVKTIKEANEQNKALRIVVRGLNPAIAEQKQAIEDLNKVINANTEFVIDNVDATVKNKINIGNYKSATEGLTGSFNDQRKRLALLTEAYKDARLEGKASRKQLNELKDAIDDQKESLDNLEDSADNASKGIKSLGNAGKAIGIGLIVAVLAKIGEFFGSSRKASLEASKAFAIFTETVKVFFGALVNSFDGAKQIFFAIGDQISNVVINVKKGFKEAKLLALELTSAFGSNADAITKLKTEINDLSKEQDILNESSNSIAGGYELIANSFNGITERAKEAVKSQQGFLQLQQDTEISIERQTRALGGLAEKRQILQDISDDDTLGFLTRTKAVEQAQKVAVEFAEKEQQLAKTKLDLTVLQVKQDLLTNSNISKSELDRIKSAEQLNNLLKNRSIASDVSSEAEASFTEAFVELKDKEIEAEAFARDAREKNRKTERDSFEQQLDILEEFQEQQFALNQALIADEKLSLEERTRLREVNLRDSQDLLNEGSKLVLEQAKISLESRELEIQKSQSLTEKQKEEQLSIIALAKEKRKELDVNKLVSESKNEVIFETIRSLNLGEIEEKRLKELIKIRKEQIKTDQDSVLVLDEANEKRKQLNLDLQAQRDLLNDTTIKNEEDLNEALDELAQKRVDNEIKRLEELISSLPENSNARLESEKELNDLLIAEKERALSEEEKATKEYNDRIKKEEEELQNALNALRDKAFDKIIERANAKSKARQDEISKSISDSEKEEDTLRSIAENSQGNTQQLALQNLQEEKEFQRRRTEELNKEKRKQVQLEVFLGGLKLLSANAGQANAVPKTLAEATAVATGLIGLIPAFKDGVRNFEGGLSEVGDGGVREVITTPDGNAYITPDQSTLVDLPSGSNVFKNIQEFNREMPNLPNIKVKSNSDNLQLIQEMRDVRKAISRIDIPEVKTDIDLVEGLITQRSRKGNKIHKYLSKI